MSGVNEKLKTCEGRGIILSQPLENNYYTIITIRTNRTNRITVRYLGTLSAAVDK